MSIEIKGIEEVIAAVKVNIHPFRTTLKRKILRYRPQILP